MAPPPAQLILIPIHRLPNLDKIPPSIPRQRLEERRFNVAMKADRHGVAEGMVGHVEGGCVGEDLGVGTPGEVRHGAFAEAVFLEVGAVAFVGTRVGAEVEGVFEVDHFDGGNGDLRVCSTSSNCEGKIGLLD